MITEIEREQLQEKMAKELGNKIEEIKQKGLINKVEYVLANWTDVNKVDTKIDTI